MTEGSESFPVDRLRREEIGALYIHAPFCARRCVYCDFAVQVAANPDTNGWLQTLQMEWDYWSRSGARVADVLDSLYIGGGTPSLLAPEAMEHIAQMVGKEGLANPDLEWTAEANPESFSLEIARAWADAGVNRVSFGVQSFDESVLRWMGRLHTPEDAVRAVKLARDHDITNLSVDLIFGLPEEVTRTWSDDLARALDLEVPHVSIYGLTVEAGTALGRRVAEGTMDLPQEGRYTVEFLEVLETLTAAGYRAYEVSNFSKPGFEARHNSAYWRHVPYLGLGNGAHSYVGGVRWWNHRSLDLYGSQLAAGRSGVSEFEIPDDKAHRLEEVWLGLRQDVGVPLSLLTAEGLQGVLIWENEGLALVSESRISLTPRGWLLLDDLAVRLCTWVTAG